MEFFCIMFNGSALDETARILLIYKSQEMFRDGNESKSLRTPISTGRLRTKWKKKTIGGITGYEFKADMYWNNKNVYVEFICKEHDLNSPIVFLKYESLFDELNLN